MTGGYDHLFTFTSMARYCITMGFVRSFVRSFVLILSFFCFFACGQLAALVIANLQHCAGRWTGPC